MNNLLLFLTLIAIGFVVGTLAEKRHYRSIHEREKKFLYFPAVTMKTVINPDKKIASAELVYGSAVISIDYFKRFLASLRNIFGGTVKSYESLIDRARREVEPFVRTPENLSVWSREFFLDVASRIKII